jgi:hypothetical protein
VLLPQRKAAIDSQQNLLLLVSMVLSIWENAQIVKENMQFSLSLLTLFAGLAYTFEDLFRSRERWTLIPIKNHDSQAGALTSLLVTKQFHLLQGLRVQAERAKMYIGEETLEQASTTFPIRV